MKTRFDKGMPEWIASHVNNPLVVDWLKRNKPPGTWKFHYMEWAYLEMPNPDTKLGRFLLWLGF